MKASVKAAVLVLGFSFAGISSRAVSADTFLLKCDAQRDTVWVYDSLTTLNVQAKLGCGQQVEVLDRANGYAKIRTAGGVEGYITENDFANLPGIQVQRAGTPLAAQSVGAAAKSAQAREMAQYAASKNALAGPAPTTSPAAAEVNTKSSAPAGIASSQYAEMAPRAAIAPTTRAPLASSMAPASASSIASPSPSPVPAAPSPAALAAATSVTVMAPAAPRMDEAPKAAPMPEDTTKIATAPLASLTGVNAEGSCRAYFSAYGLTSNQLRWIEQNRKKEFAGVCPSPDVAHVNFVFIFTHDVDFYSVTMPNRVHSSNGFSDFQPMVTVDSALMSESEANKAHREYVWVFQTANGSFDPNTFSPHRASQFAKEESNGLGGKGGQKAVEDAFRFAEGSNH